MSAEKCFCHMGGYEVKDAQAREDVAQVQGNMEDVVMSTSRLSGEVSSLSENVSRTNENVNIMQGEIDELQQGGFDCLKNGFTLLKSYQWTMSASELAITTSHGFMPSTTYAVKTEIIMNEPRADYTPATVHTAIISTGSISDYTACSNDTTVFLVGGYGADGAIRHDIRFEEIVTKIKPGTVGNYQSGKVFTVNVYIQKIINYPY